MNKRVLNQVAGIMLVNSASLLFATTSSSQTVSNVFQDRELNHSDFKISVKDPQAISQSTSKSSSGSFNQAQFLVPTEINTAQSLPIEELLDGIQQNEKPPEIIEIEEEVEKLKPQQPSTPKPETESELTPQQEQQQKRIILDAVIIDALNQTTQKYPWLVNTSDKLIINPRIYNPTEADTSVNIDWSLDSSTGSDDHKTQNLILNKFNFSHYNEQFYWILDDNRVVIETQGIHGDVRYQCCTPCGMILQSQ